MEKEGLSYVHFLLEVSHNLRSSTQADSSHAPEAGALAKPDLGEVVLQLINGIRLVNHAQTLH